MDSHSIKGEIKMDPLKFDKIEWWISCFQIGGKEEMEGLVSDVGINSFASTLFALFIICSTIRYSKWSSYNLPFRKDVN